MGGTALLVFHRNDVEGALRAVRDNHAAVDETLVVDSSPPDLHDALLRGLRETPAMVRWVLPFGCTEPLRPYAHSFLRSEFVFGLDTDEEPTQELRSQLRGMVEADGYLVRRRERSIGVESEVLRVYRRRSVRYGGWIHEAPRVDGRVERWSERVGLVHHADYRNYLSSDSRQREYLRIEAWERPTTAEQLRREFGGRISRAVFPDVNRAVPPWVATVFASTLLLRMPRTPGAFAGEIRNRHYFGRYLTARARFFARLPAEDVSEAIAISAALRAAGGPIRYLGLDDPGYVDRMTESFDWRSAGSEVLVDLLRYRYRAHRVRPDWTEPLPAMEGVSLADGATGASDRAPPEAGPW